MSRKSFWNVALVRKSTIVMMLFCNFSDFLKQLYSNTPLTKTVPEETILGAHSSSPKIVFLKVLENYLEKISFFNHVILEYVSVFTCR